VARRKGVGSRVGMGVDVGAHPQTKVNRITIKIVLMGHFL
jgi:hypothetical protein